MDIPELNWPKVVESIIYSNWVCLLMCFIAVCYFIQIWIDAIAKRALAYTFAAVATPFIILLTIVITVLATFWVPELGDVDDGLIDPVLRLAMIWCFPFSIMGIYCFLLLAIDKGNAVFNRSNRNTGKPNASRIPERVLHQCEMFGGSIGSFVAQHLFQHKVSKQSYQRTFWAIVATQIFVFAIIAITFFPMTNRSMAFIAPAVTFVVFIQFLWTLLKRVDDWFSK